MSLSIGGALRDGYDRAIAPSGRQFFLAAFVVQLFSAIVTQSRNASVQTPFFDQTIAFQPGPLAVGFGTATVSLLSLLSTIASLVLILVGIRLFVADAPERIPSMYYRENLTIPLVNLFVGLVVFAVLVGVGLFFLIVPGLFLLTALFFFGARIAVEDESFVAGMQSSWQLTSGNRLTLFLLLVAVALVGIGISIVAAIVAAPFAFLSPALGGVIEVAGTAAGSVYSTAALSRAYVQLTHEEDVRLNQPEV
jgi:hypothetical protein